jgi:cation diffusion facilitator family transporter
MADPNAPQSPSLYRIPSLKDYLILSYEDGPRRQSSAMIQSRSTTSLSALRNRSYLGTRRRKSFGADDLSRSSQENSAEDGLPEHQSRVLSSSVAHWGGGDEWEDLRRQSIPAALVTPQMRSQRLIGENPNPRYRWEQYWKTDEQLKKMKKPVRKYYERNNYLIQHYMYIDKLLDSSLPHNLIQEYQMHGPGKHSAQGTIPSVPDTITEETTPMDSPRLEGASQTSDTNANGSTQRLKRTPKDLYRIHDSENTPLLSRSPVDEEEQLVIPPDLEPEEEADSQSRIVTIAIYVNLLANTVLLILKIIVVALSSSVSVLASLVDAALDFLSTAIVWVTTRLISRSNQYAYPTGRRKLEPVGVLVFSVVMMTSFVQVGLEGFSKLTGPDHSIVQLTLLAILIMAATVVIKGLCWLWCRLIKNSSVQALAQDAMTDVVFNIFSILFPLIGYYASIWWLDPLGGILLSLWVIFNWAQTSSTHIRNLTGAAATADERNTLLYLTMRFAKTIKKIQGLQAYHSGDKLMVEVDVVLDEHTNLRDSHDLGESLQYVLESVPNGEAAPLLFFHTLILTES